MILAYGKDDAFADFATDGIAQGITHERFTKQSIGGFGEEFFLKVFLVKTFGCFFSVVDHGNRIAFFGQQLGGNVAAWCPPPAD